MNELHTRCLDLFPEWLRTLATDAGELAKVLASKTVPESTRRYVAGGLNYLFKSLDLIPDGIEDLGFLDDAFVLRVAAAHALKEAPGSKDEAPILGRLAGDTKVIADLLGKDYARLEAYVKTLTRGTARAASYETPTVSRDEKNLVKLQSFLSAKLPA
jgi:uncharacterized membrane protein YkvA (DUF1232 family)